jgi:hypothetical protein
MLDRSDGKDDVAYRVGALATTEAARLTDPLVVDALGDDVPRLRRRRVGCHLLTTARGDEK